LNKPYLLRQGDLFNVPSIFAEQRSAMFAAARMFNRNWKQPKQTVRQATIPNRLNFTDGDRPGDLFNRSATWEQILGPHGWTLASYRGETSYWRKPDSHAREHHATTGYGGRDVLFVFSTAARPFEAEKSYSKFAAYALLNHQGDFRKAAQDLKVGSYADCHLRLEDFYD
jgi:putative DNA primase/helicase